MQKAEINSLFKINFKPLLSMIKIYNSASDLNFCNNIKNEKVSNIFKKYIDTLSSLGFKQKARTTFTIPKYRYEINEENNKLLLLFSGGKDSTAAAIRFKELGYDVILYFLQGINPAYMDEIDRAKAVAEKLELPLVIEYMKVSGSGDFLENPTKNQLILSFAINYGIEHNIYRYSYGGFKGDTIEQSAFDRDFSDSIELFQDFQEGLKDIFPKFEVITPFTNEVETLTLIGNYKELWNEFQSCITPYRYRQHLKEHNEEKYNIKLFNNRCGSCWKCCMEYIVWCDLELVDYNKEFYQHCLEILSSKISEERPYAKPTKDLKETYLIYTESEELLNKSKFFKELNNA